MQCPVVERIAEIRGAAWVGGDDDAHATDSHVIRGGGSERVYDNILFLSMVRDLTVARFELSLPSESQCDEFLRGNFSQRDSFGLLRELQTSLPMAEIARKILSAVESVEQICSRLHFLLSVVAVRGGSINVSVPDLSLESLRVERVEDVAAKTNSLVDFLRRLNLSSVLGNRNEETARIQPLGEFTLRLERFSLGPLESSDSALARVRSAAEQEKRVYDYARAEERYLCDAGSHLDRIIALCEKIKLDIASAVGRLCAARV